MTNDALASLLRTIIKEELTEELTPIKKEISNMSKKLMKMESYP